MITKFIKRILRRDPMVRHTQVNQSGAPKRIAKRIHRIDPHLLSKNAVKVTHTLQQAGFEAFIVGGAVRDLVLGIGPKDFDVATNATPDQVQRLFRKARLIGRRFQIVHVTFFGKGHPEIIEVSTFRALLDNAGDHVAESGRILRDNVWGSQGEDAARRDFTINAMYYDPSTETVLDYHGGMADMEKKTLRMIGDPAKRYREDPIRMLRAIRFAAKTGFHLDPATRAPIAKLSNLLHDVPSARLFDEILKLLMSGYSWAAIQGLRDAGLHHGLLPLLDHILDSGADSKGANDFVKLALANTDQRIQSGKSVSAGFLFATLLWPDLLKNWKANIAKGISNIPALHDAMDDTIATQSSGMTIQRRFESDMREIWAMQPRFEKRVGRYPYRLIESPRFRAGYDFMLLRCATGEQDSALGEWWTSFIAADPAGQDALMASAKTELGSSATSPAKRRRRRKPKTTTPPETSAS
ncbi:polynucleotide adenylyltransferase PcnB [Polynucleobacter sp. MWH-Svant-W18]|jgi:poly(A) polymerase|uniref:polynucleotide adenylyltransferase PcnB n=1 Tax=Polynucleobacter sp. MWH-Svant-W18 TaxID=1855909 RepID=UPI001BFD1472|nr:polynucleotide adenylyltransferase PcnB [Polynucleobacter sp. MWH-Svant-W18]QWD77675.1 polynucleotide adenylyltransferase PcnB [Polynucleobacter sp. MWH-Svant-W18]